MATTINSGYANSPKLTANIADHADVYGGRALVFDGVTDYLDCGTGLGNQLGNNYSGGLSVSMWINVNSSYSSGQKGVFFIGNFGGSYGELAITINPTNFSLYFNQNGWQKNFNYTARDTWTHICFVTDAQSESNTKFYIDGEVQSIATNVANTFPSSGDLDFSGLKTVIGNFFNGNYPFHGKITDTKVFNSALTEAQVQELYKKPENTPSAVQDNLVAWYPMIEGNPESPQSIVYDHSEKKLDSNILANGTFDTDISGWVNSSPDTTSSTNFRTITHATIDGRTCIDINDQSFGGGGNRMHAYYDLGSSLLKFNTLYKISYYARKSQSDSTNKEYAVALGHQYIGITAGTVFKSVSEWDTWEYHELYIMSSTSNYRLQFLNTAFNGGIYNEHKGRLFLDDIKVQKVLMGNHATTNFFGDDLQTGTWNNNDPLTNGMQGFTGASADGFTAVNGASGAGDNDASYGDEISFTAGKTYQLSFTNTINSGTMPSLFVGVTSGTAGSADNIMSYATISSTGDYSYNFTPSSTVTRRPSFRFVANGAYDFTISNFAVKEVGISSSGFETAVNEPVVPQVPLMRYNQKAIFDRNKNTYVSLTEQTFEANTAFTIAFSFTPFNNAEHHIIGKNSTDDTIRVDTSGAHRIAIRINNDFGSMGGTGDVNANESHFCVITRTTGGAFSVYRNGVKSTASFTNTSDFKYQYLGQSLNGGWESDGLLDEFSIFNTHFSDAEAQELFNDGVALDATTHSKADDHLLAYYRNDGVTTWTDRGDIQAIGFNGVSNHSIQNNNSIGNALGDNYTGDLSISVWFKRTQISISGGLVDIGYDAFDLGIFTLFINSSNELTFSLVDNAWNLKENFTDTDWNHVLAVYKAGSESDTKLYLNGSSVGTATGTFPSTSDMDVNGKSTFVGLYRSVGQSFTGIIGQTAIWTKELSSIEVSEIYNLGRRDTDLTTSYSTNLLAYYLLNPTHSNPDTTGSNNILDRSGNNHHATQQNGVNFFGTNDGSVQGSPDSITIREGLNSNRDGLGFYFTNPSSNVLRLNGESEYLHIENDTLAGKPTGTISFWAKTSGTSTQSILGYHRSQWSIRLNKTTVFMGIGGIEVTASSSLDNSGWGYHAITFDQGTAKFYKLNLDTPLYHTSTDYLSNNVKTFPSNTNGIFIGKRNHANANFYNGLVDEIKIYDRVLTLDELTKNYKHQKGKHKND